MGIGSSEFARTRARLPFDTVSFFCILANGLGMTPLGRRILGAGIDERELINMLAEEKKARQTMERRALRAEAQLAGLRSAVGVKEFPPKLRRRGGTGGDE